MELLGIEQHGFHRVSGEAGYRQLDSHGFNTIELIVREDVNGNPVGTVLFSGLPVMVVFSEGWGWEMPEHNENAHGEDQTTVAFLVAIDEVAAEFEDGETAINWVSEHSLMDLYERSSGVGDGHEICEFAGLVAKSMYSALSDEGQLTDPREKGWH